MKNYGTGKVQAINNGETIAIKVGASYFDITTDGEVNGEIEVTLDTTPGVIEGQGTEDEPFVIMSIEDLVLLSKQVNEGTNYSGKYVELGKTLDFNSDLSYVNPKTTDYDTYLGGDGTKGLKEQLTEGIGFVPIGNERNFQGVFDGKNNWLKNIYINKQTNNVGLFGAAYGLTIQNLNLSGEINGLSNAGGIIGKTEYTNTIINCNNYAQVEGTTLVGGIIGFGEATIEKCNNYGTIIGTDTTNTRVGGISGANGRIRNCVNYGKISGPSYIGGICGMPNSGRIFECINKGEVSGGNYIGGICGFGGNSGIIERCCNTGKITGTSNVGGISGLIYRGGYIRCAYNLGEVTGKENIGGIVANCNETWNRSNVISNCYNWGIVTGNKNVGQAIGILNSSIVQYHANMYYLNSGSNKGIGNLDDVEGVVEGKTADELKNEDFLTLLNAAHTHTVDGTEVDYTLKCWAEDEKNINSGYPIFSSQAHNSEE